MACPFELQVLTVKFRTVSFRFDAPIPGSHNAVKMEFWTSCAASEDDIAYRSCMVLNDNSKYMYNGYDQTVVHVNCICYVMLICLCTNC